jgi:mutator protein MutT
MTTVAAGLFIEGSKILIAKRAEGQSLAGFWEFPGGKQEAGGSILGCLEREIREEFGVSCNRTGSPRRTSPSPRPCRRRDARLARPGWRSAGARAR